MRILTDVQRMEDPNAGLERALIEAFILARGHNPKRLDELPAAERRELLTAAAAYAGARLAEMESRAHYLHDLLRGH